jgi:alpha-tubulin suppressor-like RCC1 family protein
VMDSVGTRKFFARVTNRTGQVFKSAILEVATETQPQIAMGGGFICALRNDDMRCSGDNFGGELGSGDNIDVSYGKFRNVSPIKFPTGFKIKQITAGSSHTCALSEEGKVICWGKNDFGQLGYGDITDRGGKPETTPDKLGFVGLPPVKTIVSGNFANYTCAVLVSEAVKCWGENTFGQLGLGNKNNIGDNAGEIENMPAINLGTSPVKKIAVGGDHACALLLQGSMHCWGRNDSGQLGYRNTNNFGDQPGETPNTVVVAIANIVQVSLGSEHTCVITVFNTSNKVRCWGEGFRGQLGYGNTKNIGDNELPTDVGFVNIGADVVQLSLSVGVSCVLLEDNSVKCWGDGRYLGYGNTEDIGDNELPTAVGAISLNTDITQGKVIRIFSGGRENCALFESGNIKCWGDTTFLEIPSNFPIIPLF